jgi:uncharacterized protein YheU (UPF0270 family)
MTITPWQLIDQEIFNDLIEVYVLSSSNGVCLSNNCSILSGKTCHFDNREQHGNSNIKNRSCH